VLAGHHTQTHTMAPNAGREHMNFNLLQENWIPILYTNGHPDRVSIRTALTEAHEIRQIAASNPMDNVALLRFLLAVLMWCSPRNDRNTVLHGADRIPADWLKKLDTSDQVNQSFVLLRDKGGFCQYPTTARSDVAVTNLFHEFPSASNIAHFRHVRDERDGLCLACCALALVRWPVLASAGTAGARQSMTASINGNTPAFAIPIGSDLLATLVQAWPRAKNVDGDLPIWDGASEESPLGVLKGLTWLSRRVELAPANECGNRDLHSGQCSHCGEHSDEIVLTIQFRPGWKRPTTGPWAEDPHLLRISRPKGNPVVPMLPSPNKALEEHADMWRSVEAGLLQRCLSAESATNHYTVLVSNVQALYKDITFALDAVPDLDQNTIEMLQSQLDWLKTVTWLLVSARTHKWNDPPKGHALIEALRAPNSKGQNIRAALCALSLQVNRDLQFHFRKSKSQGVPDAWRRAVADTLGRHVEQAVRSTTPGSPLRRREAVASAQGTLDRVLRNASTPRDKASSTEDAPKTVRRRKRKKKSS